MTNYKRILVAMDGSVESDLALKKAIETAKRNHSILEILQVIDDDQNVYGRFGGQYGALIDHKKEVVEQEMEKRLEFATYENDLQVETTILVGNPKRLIVDHREAEHDVDLLLVGATGKGAIEAMVLGSVSSYILAHAYCDVLVVRS